MSIQLGDRVRFLNENIEGTVTRMIDKNLVGVTTDDDFEIPVPMSQVVKVGFTGKKQDPVKETKAPAVSLSTELGIFLLFEPAAEGMLAMKLANLLSSELIFTFGTFRKKEYRTECKGSLSLNEIENLMTLRLEDFSDWPVFVFNCIPAPARSESIQQPVHRQIKFNPKEFHGSFRFSKVLGKQAYVFRIDEELNLVDLQKLRDRDFQEKRNTGIDLSNDVQTVTDLHIDAVPDAPARLLPHEMMQVQFGYFRRQLEKGVAAGLEKMIFIHGVGDGILKRKVREYLDKYPKAVRVKDADELKYGKGATEVWFV